MSCTLSCNSKFKVDTYPKSNEELHGSYGFFNEGSSALVNAVIHSLCHIEGFIHLWHSVSISGSVSAA